MKRYLVIAHETVGGDALVDEVRRRADDGDVAVHVVVPALGAEDAASDDHTVAGGGTTPTSFADPQADTGSTTSGTTDTPPGGITDLGRKGPSLTQQTHTLLAHVVDRLERVAAQVTGDIGPTDPLDAARAALAAQRYDGLILATPPPGASKLVGQDLGHRLQRAVDLEVKTVYAERTDPREAE